MLKRLVILIAAAALAAPVFAGGYGGRHHYGWGAHYSHHGGGDGAALAAGLLVGGLIGYFISEDRYYRHQAYRDHRYPRYYGYAEPVYRVREYRYVPHSYRETTWVEPRPAPVAVPATTEFPGHACRMTREYTTTIEIDGRNHEAYGTRCLTADGSWVLGRPKLVPELD